MPQDEWKTLRVPKDDYEEAKREKEANNRTWGEQLLQSDSQDSEQIAIENVEINSGESKITADDVERIVERWVEKNLDKLKRGQL